MHLSMMYHKSQFWIQYHFCLLFIPSVTKIIQHHRLLGYSYANDIHIYFFCKPDEVTEISDAFSKCVGEIYEWMCCNKLKLNSDKTECI